MPSKTALIAMALAASFATPVSATTLVTSLDAFRAGVGATVTSTPNPGNYDTMQSVPPVTSSISLGDGAALSFSNAAAVTSPAPGGFPYALADGFSGELFVPQDADGIQVSSETISFGRAVDALGFEVAPYSSATPIIFLLAGAPFATGPHTISVTLSDGETSSVSLPGGDAETGTTESQFFGFYGGGVTSLTIDATDPNGFGFGNFVDALDAVPVVEPGSAALVLAGLAGLLRRRLSGPPAAA